VASGCRRCGEILNANANFCWFCGASQHDDKGVETASLPVVVNDDLLGAAAQPSGDSDCLLISRGQDEGDLVELTSDIVSVGRHEDSVVVLDDVSVSRHHAVFTRTASGRWTVRDLNSLNGTYVNGERVDEVVLRSGDEIRVGKYKVVFWGVGK
jgi:hypothetical protein